jgi:hypothetical protein
MRVLKALGFDAPLPQTVAVAVELWDPVTTLPTSTGIGVTVRMGGRDVRPKAAVSGRFVVLGARDLWPTEISVDPGTLPYEAIDRLDVAASRPAGWPDVEPIKRLLRIPLTPASTYPFADGVTAISGYLFELNAGQRVPIANATVWFEWYDTANNPPTPRQIAAERFVTTDALGQFGVFDRVPRVMGHAPDTEKGLIKVRLGVTRAGATKYSPDDCPFLPPPAAGGRIPEGVALADWANLDWANLVNQ